ncbi:MAG: hypothetical protein QNJ47_17895 [Nostocaceae cyanobacterium]|nr:hypothetical protein [Nostocaceae cyanobacterium]
MNSQLIRTVDLLTADVEDMYLLLSTHFQGVKRDVFDIDLSNKNWVILFRDDETEQLKGFSTLLMYNTQFQGENISVVYSGDTIIDPTAWSSSILSRAWIGAVNKLRSNYVQGKLYWLLISAGYRTYRFLPVFWKDFYPRYDVPTPKHIAELMDFLGRDRFGDEYDSQAGVVRFTHPHVLKEGLRGIPQERLKDSHIQFFDSKNPGHINGDELLCLTEICESNLTSAGRRMWFSRKNNQQLQVVNRALAEKLATISQV